MLSIKFRNVSIAAVTTLSLAGAALVPAASQAQFNNFGILHSAEGIKLQTNPGTGPGCQPLFPVGGSGVSTPIPPSGNLTVAGIPSTGATSAQQEVATTVGPAMEVQVCEAG